MVKIKTLILMVSILISISPISNAADDKLPVFDFVTCNTQKDFTKIGGEVVIAVGKIMKEKNLNPNELMFLVSMQRKITGNTLSDSIGYFVHDKDDPKSLFALVLWLEEQKACLVFNGLVLREEDPVKFFNFRKEILNMMDDMKKK